MPGQSSPSQVYLVRNIARDSFQYRCGLSCSTMHCFATLGMLQLRLLLSLHWPYRVFVGVAVAGYCRRHSYRSLWTRYHTDLLHNFHIRPADTIGNS